MTPIEPPSLCPRCREEMRVSDWGAGFQAVCLECRWRSCRYPSAEKAETDIAPLAWFEPRDRLPTPEEESAAREKYGPSACFYVRQKLKVGWGDWRRYIRALEGGGELQSILMVEGRPVGWPEVKT